MDLVSYIDQLTAQIQLFIAAVSLVLALFQVFAGYRLLRGWVSAAASLIGFACGCALVTSINADSAIWVKILVGVIIGAILGWVGWKIYLLAVFIYCGMCASSLVLEISFPETYTWSVISFVLAIGAFIAAGVLSVRFSRPTIIIMTSLGGARAAVNAMTVLGFDIAAAESSRVFCFIALVLAGLVVQFLTTGGVRRRRRR